MAWDIYVVVKFFGNRDILGSQKLDSVWFVREDAERRAERMQKKHNWIWRVIPCKIDIAGMQDTIRAELAARGISTT